MDSAITARIAEEVQRLPEGVRAHIEQVRQAAVALATRWGLDVDRAELAALAHDVRRNARGEELLAMARAYGIPVTPVEEAFPVLIHGPVGAELLKRTYGLDDDAVLDPIRYHTTGRAGMSRLEVAFFLADKLDPSKVSRYPFIAEVDRLAREDLDRALLCFIDNQIRVFLDQGSVVHPGMNAARNDAVLALRRKKPQGT